jgi:hypothetical protein
LPGYLVPMTTPKLRALHRQVGLGASLFLLIAALTTLVINHRELLFPPVRDVKGPYDQYLLSHAICASHPDKVLVGTASGLFLSEDGGNSFTSINLPVPARQVVAVAFHPNEPSHYYAVLRQDGVFSSIDGGKLWTKVNFPSQVPIQSFQVGFDGTLSVLTGAGLHRRVQESWTLIPGTEASGAPPKSGHRDVLRLAYRLHDGTFWGAVGIWVTDLLAVSILFLVGSGWTLWRRLARGK